MQFFKKRRLFIGISKKLLKIGAIKKRFNFLTLIVFLERTYLWLISLQPLLQALLVS
jgi:hypothetical protein